MVSAVIASDSPKIVASKCHFLRLSRAPSLNGGMPTADRRGTLWLLLSQSIAKRLKQDAKPPGFQRRSFGNIHKPSAYPRDGFFLGKISP